MISSEVQRTLVKSPPELWAEISDPDSLARHLGEFGEIRITRVQPEQKVEWETDEASGSVVIKPSGWGTKVKLTVTRELPEIAAPEPLDEPCITPDGESESSPADELESDVNDETAPTLETDLAAEHDAFGPDADPEPLADGPADELEAPEEIAPTLADEREPALEQDLESEYELDEESEPVAAERVAMADPEPLSKPEPRRGFFARLFGRRRTARATEPMSEHATDVEADEELSAARQDEPEADSYETISDWEAEVELEAERGGEPQLDANDEVERQAQPDAVHEPEPGPTRALELEVDGEPTLEAGLDARRQLEPIDDAAAVELPSSASAGEEPAEAPAAHDIAAELEAAEAIAAEQVTAVLTGVLDRLGAAHHRPFSRA
jgi:pilus assembly protein FimV